MTVASHILLTQQGIRGLRPAPWHYFRGGSGLSLPWVLLPPRIAGVIAIAIPLAVTGNLRLTKSAAPLVLATGVPEIVGWLFYSIGARESIAVAAVLSSLFAAFATIGAFFLFRERLSRYQLLGVALIVLGVTALTAALV